MPKFHPTELLFSPTTACNLSCLHCNIKKRRNVLSVPVAVKFLRSCAGFGIRRVGFTGGEPFLALPFLTAIIRESVTLGLKFDRITTNGSFFKNKHEAASALKKILDAGYDGDLLVSVDAFHAGQDLKNVAFLIRSAVALSGRADIVSLAVVRGALDKKTDKRLDRLAHLLGARAVNTGSRRGYIKGKGLFIRIVPIMFSSAGLTRRFKDPWDGAWFKEDYCKGPGNVFFVLPDGKVKPCCGYANDSELLTIGNIGRDMPQKLVSNLRSNGFTRAVFEKGLQYIRKRMENAGLVCPGKTSDHCFFCAYTANLISNSRPIPRKRPADACRRGIL
jgi:hypothetical protein